MSYKLTPYQTCGGLVSKFFLILAIPWTSAHQTPLSMGFSRQEYWNGLTFPSPGDLPDPGIGPGSPALWADSLPAEPPYITCKYLLPFSRLPCFVDNFVHYVSF